MTELQIKTRNSTLSMCLHLGGGVQILQYKTHFRIMENNLKCIKVNTISSQYLSLQ